MDPQKYRSAIASTINNLLNNDKAHRHETIENAPAKEVDMGGFVQNLKKEIINLKIPIYDLRVSSYRHNVLVLELPFCESCEISIDPVEFGSDQKKATLYIDKKPVRRIKLEKLDPEYMKEVAIALVDYFKRYLLLKNKFES